MRISDWSSDVCSSDLRHIEILGQGLEAAGDLRDLLHAVVGALVDRRLHELQVVDHDEAEAVLALQAAGAGAHLADREGGGVVDEERSEEHTSELQSLMRISYAVFCLKKKKTQTTTPQCQNNISKSNNLN